MAIAEKVVDALRKALGDDALLSGDDARNRAYSDWSEAPSVAPDLVVRPLNAGQVADVLGICALHKQPVAVQGGLTGLAGGANPRAGEVVLSLERLNHIEDLDVAGGTIIAGAGVTLQQLQEFVETRGWFFPVDLGARGSAQIGGNASTNAGGNRVLRYGMMRESVLGVEVALADGTLLTMLDRVLKNNTGIDLKHLFIGSEGALGVITRLSLRLHPLAAASRTVLCALPDFEAATRLLHRARTSLPGLSSFELMWASYFDASVAAGKLASPFGAAAHPLYALIETLGASEDAASIGLEQLMEAALEDGTIVDAVVAQSLDQARGLWAIREGVSALLPITSPNIAFDVSVPLSEMGAFVERMDAKLCVEFGSARHMFFGHLGDGNLHLLSGPLHDTEQLLRVEHLVYQEVQRVGGSISAEHGIGIVKRPFLHYSRTTEERSLMRRVKQSLDPLNILNPDRIFEGGDGYAAYASHADRSPAHADSNAKPLTS